MCWTHTLNANLTPLMLAKSFRCVIINEIPFLSLSLIILTVFVFKLASREIPVSRLVVVHVCLRHHFEGSHEPFLAFVGTLPWSKGGVQSMALAHRRFQ